MNEIVLSGCHTRPLASYLKALAVLRLVSEQADPKAKGFWRNDQFVLITELAVEGLVDFFVTRYAPTPIVSPWSGGSGFYDGDSTDGMDAILASRDSRFDGYRQAIQEVFTWPEMPRRFETVGALIETLEAAAEESKGKKRADLLKLVSAVQSGRDESLPLLDGLVGEALHLEEIERSKNTLKGAPKKVVSSWWKEIKKARTKCTKIERDREKDKRLSVCRAKLGEHSLAWLDATIAHRADGGVTYNPVLGSGGNEGRLDFASNFMQRVAELLIQAEGGTAAELLRTTLLGEPRTGLVSAAIGQFDPGRAGGYNQGPGVETKSFKINPWDFIFTLEGAVALSSAVTRRSIAGGRGYASLPFTVQYSGVGFSSSSMEEGGKAETWLPVWQRPAGYDELRYLFAEGRSTVGGRLSRDGLDFARAVGLLGVDRGIEAFERYAFVVRRGKSYVAMPAGRFPVRYRPEIRLLDDLDPLLGRLDAFLWGFPPSLRRVPKVPATFSSARRRIDRAVFECAVDPTAEHFGGVLRALGQMEFWIAQRDRSKKPALGRPLLGLRPSWIRSCDDGGPEIRIAAALASIHATGGVGPLRSNLAGVDAAKPWQWDRGHGQRRFTGVDLVERLGSVLEQRLMDAERFGAPVVPVSARVSLSPADVVPFLLGQTDDRRLEELLWGLTLVNWSEKDKADDVKGLFRSPLYRGPLPRGWGAMKLLLRPGPIRGVHLSTEPRICALLRSRRAREAVSLAHRRLRVSGLRPLPVEPEDWIAPRRQLAGLLVPTVPGPLLEELVLQPSENDHENTKTHR